ncbi:MAG: carbohydrate ABC transporter permease [Limnochordales bacterium]|nr:carbohydrate ABC transporter permease [Limnochordales bacterium]
MRNAEPVQEGWSLETGPLSRAAWFVFLLVLALLALFPLWWMFTTALKPASQIFAGDLSLFPRGATLDHFRRLMGTFNLARIMGNTLVVAAVTTGFQLITSLLAAYGFARYRFPLREPLFYLCLGTMFIPIQVIMVSNYLLVSDWGLLNTYAAAILPQAASAFGVFFLRQQLRLFPQSLLDAARIDGAGELTVLFRIVLPTIRPFITALGILFFINAWNQYVWPVLVLTDPDMMTLPIALREFMHSEAGHDWGLMMAASTMGVLPALIAFLLAQRMIMSTFASTGLKG